METGGKKACGLFQLIAKVFESNAAPVCAWVDGWVHNRCGEEEGMQRRWGVLSGIPLFVYISKPAKSRTL